MLNKSSHLDVKKMPGFLPAGNNRPFGILTRRIKHPNRPLLNAVNHSCFFERATLSSDSCETNEFKLF